MQQRQVHFKDSEVAFNEAIASGLLSDKPQDYGYAGNFMYMGTWDGVDQFKHIETRRYYPGFGQVGHGPNGESDPYHPFNGDREAWANDRAERMP